MPPSVTQSELARELGISQRSVSVALGGAGRISENTRRAVLETAKRRGYRPNRLASSLRKGQTESVGVVWAFVNPWSGDSEIGMQILHRLQKRGLTTYHVQHDDNRAINLLRDRLAELVSRRVDALVVQGTPGELMDPGVLDVINGVPTIAVCREDLPDFPGDLIIHDRFAAIREVVDHLASTGRRRLAMAISVDEESNRGKFEVFARRCRELGLPEHPHELIDLPYPQTPHNTGGRHAAGMRAAFPGQVSVDAIFSFNDFGAMYVMRDLKARGLRIPEDVAVVGFNNTEPAAVWDPPLASGDREFEKTAAAIDDCLSRRLADPDLAPQRETVPMRFVWRESAGGQPPAAHAASDPSVSHPQPEILS